MPLFLPDPSKVDFKSKGDEYSIILKKLSLCFLWALSEITLIFSTSATKASSSVEANEN